jgi:hypothetical protein
MSENQISLSWLPDKGDLTIHRLEIRRGGEVIDLLAVLNALRAAFPPKLITDFGQ